MILIDYRDKRPLYEQIYEKIELLIIRGGLEANTKMPSVRSLALELSINPNTIQRAYSLLEQDGYLYTIVGRGNFVTDKSEWQRGKLNALSSELTTLLISAKDIGMPQETIENIVAQIYLATEEELIND